jgi:hypothetical protein
MNAVIEPHGLAFVVGASGLEDRAAFAAITTATQDALAAMPAADVRALHDGSRWNGRHWRQGAVDRLFAILWRAADPVLVGPGVRYHPFLWIEAQALP